MRTAAALLTAVVVLIPAGGASAHELPMKDANMVAKKKFTQIMRWVRNDDNFYKKGVKVNRRVYAAELGRCQPQSDHLAICAYSWRDRTRDPVLGSSTMRCYGDIYVKYTASKRRRIGVAEDFIDCE